MGWQEHSAPNRAVRLFGSAVSINISPPRGFSEWLRYGAPRGSEGILAFNLGVIEFFF